MRRILSGLCLALACGCSPVYSTQPVADPPHVWRVVIWETDPRSRVRRVALVEGRRAQDLADCFTYQRQDNPFYNLSPFKVIGAIGTKVYAEGVILLDDFTAVPIAFFFDNELGSPKGGGRLPETFGVTYARLSWQPAALPASQPVTTGE